MDARHVERGARPAVDRFPHPSPAVDLSTFRTLGRSGLVVSPLALGTMTFGTARWGSPDDVSRAVFDAYVDAGGNFVDTADVYAKGRGEDLLGTYVAGRGLRDQLALATKCTFNAAPPNPNAGGNGRKNVHRALDGSLRRLQTDYVDLYWLHAWDTITPVDEVLQTFGDLVRAGKVRYFGLSNVPAWYATGAATLAQAHAVPGPIALQLEYSLVARSVEHELLPAARERGLGVCPWSPLAGGFLAGKYERADEEAQVAGAKATGEGRLAGGNPGGAAARQPGCADRQPVGGAGSGAGPGERAGAGVLRPGADDLAQTRRLRRGERRRLALTDHGARRRTRRVAHR